MKIMEWIMSLFMAALGIFFVTIFVGIECVFFPAIGIRTLIRRRELVKNNLLSGT